MRCFFLAILYNTLFISCQSPEILKTRTTQSRTHRSTNKTLSPYWPRESFPHATQWTERPLKRGPQWPEKVLAQDTQWSQASQPRVQIGPKRRQGPEWPEKILEGNEPQVTQILEFPSSVTNKPELNNTHKNGSELAEKNILRGKPSGSKGVVLKTLEGQKVEGSNQPQATPEAKDEPSTVDVIKSSMASVDPHVQAGLADLMDMFTMNLDFDKDNDPNLSTDSSDTSDSSEDSSSFERRSNRRYIDKYTPPRHFTRTYNKTHNANDRTFKYMLCDNRYLRNICQFAIIYAFRTVCERYNCSHNIMPRVWDMVKIKCEKVMQKYNPDKVWNGTYKYYRNNRLSPYQRWPLFNGKVKHTEEVDEEDEDYWGLLRNGTGKKGGRKPKGLQIHRKRNYNGKKPADYKINVNRKKGPTPKKGGKLKKV